MFSILKFKETYTISNSFLANYVNLVPRDLYRIIEKGGRYN